MAELLARPRFLPAMVATTSASICALAFGLILPPCSWYPPSDVATSATVVGTGGGGCAFLSTAIALCLLASPAARLMAMATLVLARVAPLTSATSTPRIPITGAAPARQLRSFAEGREGAGARGSSLADLDASPWAARRRATPPPSPSRAKHRAVGSVVIKLQRLAMTILDDLGADSGMMPCL